jgi:hypothetical protein
MKRVVGPVLWGAMVAAVLSGPGASAQPPSPSTSSGASLPAPLEQIQSGQWELRSIDAAQDAPTRLCLGEVRQLLQPHHPGALCRQFVSESGPDKVTVTYDCGARGQGRTALRVETPRLVQIDSQGVSDGRPFALRLEGRHVGACSASGGGGGGARPRR